MLARKTTDVTKCGGGGGTKVVIPLCKQSEYVSIN